MNENLNPIELDFIDFISKRNGLSPKESEKIFLETKKTFLFAGRKYNERCHTIHDLYKIFYHDKTEERVIDSYKFHSIIHLYRYLSYSYPPKQKPWYSKIFRKPKKDYEYSNKYAAVAKYIYENLNDTPIIVDYGCGLGYISFEIGLLDSATKIYLIDIDCLAFEFVEYRFKKHGLNAEVIPITTDNLYPKLPPHNISIASEVLEHVFRPVEVYDNINASMSIGGILYGDFRDHHPEMFHVSPRLEAVRKKISENFEQFGKMYYRKIR